MTAHAALADINVATRQFERGVGFYGRYFRHLAFDKHHRHDLDNAADGDDDGTPQQHLHRPAFDPAVPMLAGRDRNATFPGGGLGFFIRQEGALLAGFEQVVNGDQRAGEEQPAADGPHGVHGDDLLDRIQKVTPGKGAFGRKFFPHQGLRPAGEVQRYRVKNDPQRADPEVYVS